MSSTLARICWSVWSEDSVTGVVGFVDVEARARSRRAETERARKEARLRMKARRVWRIGKGRGVGSYGWMEIEDAWGGWRGMWTGSGGRWRLGMRREVVKAGWTIGVG